MTTLPNTMIIQAKLDRYHREAARARSLRSSFFRPQRRIVVFENLRARAWQTGPA